MEKDDNPKSDRLRSNKKGIGNISIAKLGRKYYRETLMILYYSFVLKIISLVVNAYIINMVYWYYYHFYNHNTQYLICKKSIF